MKLLGNSLVVLVAAVAPTSQAFVVLRPPTRVLTVRRPSVRLPTPSELLETPAQQPLQQVQVEEDRHQQQQAPLMATDVAATAASQAGGARPGGGPKAKGRAPVVVIEEDMLETTTEHRALVATHYLVSLLALGQVASAYQDGASPAAMAALAGTVAFSVVFSDFFSGVFHWSVDNYGDRSTPLLGGVIAAFQGHHDAPWTITHRGFANNVHKITKITIPAMAMLLALGHVPEHPLLGLFATLFFNLQVLSQEFHKWSHLSKPPTWVAALQDWGLVISRKEHGQHHSSPFESNYCILTGMCNQRLDESGFFRRLERVVYEVTGAEPNCWKFGEEGDATRALALTEQQQQQQQQQP